MFSKLLKRSVPTLRRAHSANPVMASRISPMTIFQRHFADKKVPLPSLGAESITEGEVTEWSVAVGDTVSEGDILCSIETDKVTVEVEAPFGGVIKAFHAEVGDNVEVGKDLLTIDEGGSGGGGGAGIIFPSFFSFHIVLASNLHEFSSLC
jgi:biotin carboxyl carrier protein